MSNETHISYIDFEYVGMDNTSNCKSITTLMHTHKAVYFFKSSALGFGPVWKNSQHWEIVWRRWFNH